MSEDTQQAIAYRLARWRQARSALSSCLNHDLRAPLTAIVGFAELLSEENLTPEQQTCVQRILEATDRIVHILEKADKILNEAELEP
jgi:signal transduction histidine kinase